MKETELNRHKRIGKNLVTPLNHAFGDKVAKVSWYPNTLPDYLWLAICFLPETRMDTMRALVDSLKIVDEFRRYKTPLPRFQFLASLKQTQFDRLLAPFLLNDDLRSNLAALKFLPSFPSQKRWAQVLPDIEENQAYQILARAVAAAIHHQGQSATDIAFTIYAFYLRADRVRMPPEMLRDVAELMNNYSENPTDPRRSSFRAMRNGIHGEVYSKLPGQHSDWSDRFWKWGKKSTECMEPPSDDASDRFDIRSLQHEIIHTLQQNDTALYFFLNEDDGGVARDHRREVIAGMNFYASAVCASCVSDSPFIAQNHLIVARVISDIALSLNYLLSSEDSEIWEKFKSYGYGRYKLFHLKAEDLSERPSAYDEMRFSEIVDEYAFIEFVDMNLGSFFKKNMREIATDLDMKSFYDTHYSWTSAFIHAEWGALRALNFKVCFNPLHRFHYIPTIEAPSFKATLELVFSAFNEINQTLRDACGLNELQDLVFPIPEEEQQV